MGTIDPKLLKTLGGLFASGGHAARYQVAKADQIARLRSMGATDEEVRAFTEFASARADSSEWIELVMKAGDWVCRRMTSGGAFALPEWEGE